MGVTSSRLGPPASPGSPRFAQTARLLFPHHLPPPSPLTSYLTSYLPSLVSPRSQVIAQVSHIQMDAEAPSADLEKLHWARRMALTSVDYSQVRAGGE